MSGRIYLVGVALACCVLYFAFVANVGGSIITMHASAIAWSYLIYSTLAYILSTFGKSRKSKAALFFGCGVGLLFIFLPSLEHLMSWYYLPSWSSDPRDGRITREVFRELQYLYFYSPMIVSALMIYAGIRLWADDSLAKKEAQPGGTDNSGAAPLRV